MPKHAQACLQIVLFLFIYVQIGLFIQDKISRATYITKTLLNCRRRKLMV